METPKILDTTIAENGPEQIINSEFLELGTPLRFHADIGSGDTVLIEGRLSQAHDWDLLHTFTDETPVDIYPSYLLRARRSVDGGTEDSKIHVQNPYNSVELSDHTA